MPQAASKPIRTRSPLKAGKAIKARRPAIEQWVRRWHQKKINLNDPDFVFNGPRANRKERDDVLRYARALQTELVHFEGWGTPRS